MHLKWNVLPMTVNYVIDKEEIIWFFVATLATDRYDAEKNINCLIAIWWL